MNKMLGNFMVVLLTAASSAFGSCGGNSTDSAAPAAGDTVAEQAVAASPETGNKATVKDGTYDKKKSFIVISKKLTRLSVYAEVDGDTVLLARYPACLSKNKGNKQKKGDMRTPESPKGKPFRIQQVQDASSWHHDFGDGRGNIKAYGHWFLRLETPGHTGIGIHGSTNNENTVPGRASEGCIRLHDLDIINLKEQFAYVGMPVIIQAEDEDPLPFEQAAKRMEVKTKASAAASKAPVKKVKDREKLTEQVDEGELTIRDPGEQYHAHK